MADRIRIDHGNFESAKARIREWKIPTTVKRELYDFLEDLGLGKVNRGRRISPLRQIKYLYALRRPLEFFNTPTAALTSRDIENFERALNAGKLANHFTGRPFAHSTQVDMRMLLKVFLRWRVGSTRAEKLAGWLDTRWRPRTPEFLKENEVKSLYKHCRTAAQRFLIAMLFDSGARAEEFHNIRFEDIYLPEPKSNFVKIALKQEYSKTLGRTIALYWEPSLESVKEMLDERLAEGIKPNEPVFKANYDATKKFLQRLGKRVLNRPVYYHLFRHSSATYYATKLNRQELCYRYGWKFSSSMPDVYISRAGMETKALDEKFTQTELGGLKDDLFKLEQITEIKDERIRQLEESMRVLQQNFQEVSQILTLNPRPDEIDKALQRKKNTMSKRI